jgi:uncharacterized protein (DUF1810 family)
MDHDLDRFARAQAPHLDDVRAELRAGMKRTHWMWFVFPQLRGLGRSEMARRYGLASLAEARAYLAHPVLGPRLRENVSLLLDIRDRTAHEIFGSPDDLKLHSCMTLFREVDGEDGLFARALERFFAGRPDASTLALLRDRQEP